MSKRDYPLFLPTQHAAAPRSAQQCGHFKLSSLYTRRDRATRCLKKRGPIHWYSFLPFLPFLAGTPSGPDYKRKRRRASEQAPCEASAKVNINNPSIRSSTSKPKSNYFTPTITTTSAARMPPFWIVSCYDSRRFRGFPSLHLRQPILKRFPAIFKFPGRPTVGSLTTNSPCFELCGSSDFFQG